MFHQSIWSLNHCWVLRRTLFCHLWFCYCLYSSKLTSLELLMTPLKYLFLLQTKILASYGISVMFVISSPLIVKRWVNSSFNRSTMLSGVTVEWPSEFFFNLVVVKCKSSRNPRFSKSYYCIVIWLFWIISIFLVWLWKSYFLRK